MKYYLTYTYNDPSVDYMDKYVIYNTLEEALGAINATAVNYDGNYTFTLIEGREIKLKPIEVVTKYGTVNE